MTARIWLLALALLAPPAHVALGQQGLMPQVPGITPAKENRQTAESAPAPAEESADNIEAIRSELTALDRKWRAWLAAPPAGIPPAEIEEALLVCSRVLTLIDGTLTLEQGMASLRSEQNEVLATIEKATPAKTDTPVSLVELDEIEGRRVMLAGERAAIESSRAMLIADATALEEQAKRAGEAKRRAEDQLAGATEENRPLQEFRNDAAKIKLELARQSLRYNQAKRNEQSVRSETLDATIQALLAQADALRPQVEFTPEHLEPLLADIDRKIETQNARRAKVVATIPDLEAKATAARAKLDESLAIVAEDDARPPAEGRLRLESLAADSELAAARLESEILTMRARLLEEERKAWQIRLAFFDPASDPTKRVENRRTLDEMRRRIAEWSDFAATQAAVTRAEKDRQINRVQGLSTATDRRLAERVAAAVTTRANLADSLAYDLQGLRARLDLWSAMEQARLADQSLSARVGEIGAKIKGVAARIWNFELVVLGGTGVTLGKVVTVLLFFLIGLLIATKAARRMERILVSRFHFGEPQARTVRRWVVSFLSLLLLLFALHLVRIPVTAFAFLGGALAIGVGFGTQTLIKNLISGLLVLGERKVRIGDTIEVGNKTGVVTSIDLRSTTVRGFDGVETLVPNSFLLEQQVTNWTHSDRNMRRSILVGVAYGTPTRKVTDLLMEIAQRHGQVLEKPAPIVLFTDFADSSLLFELRVWVDLEGPQAAPIVESDLRHMIAKSFAEHGIEIPFPQRDIHVRTGPPPIQAAP